MYLVLLCCLYLSSIYYRSEAQSTSLTCSNATASACPGTEVTLCTCITTSPAQSWTVPGDQLSFAGQDGVDDERTSNDGAFTATITDDIGARVSVLTYTATTTLMDANIECQDLLGSDPVTDTVTVTFAGKE